MPESSKMLRQYYIKIKKSQDKWQDLIGAIYPIHNELQKWSHNLHGTEIEYLQNVQPSEMEFLGKCNALDGFPYEKWI